jgi:hypothetical protein
MPQLNEFRATINFDAESAKCNQNCRSDPLGAMKVSRNCKHHLLSFLIMAHNMFSIKIY